MEVLTGTGIDDLDGGCVTVLCSLPLPILPPRVEELRRATRGEAGGWTGGLRTTDTTLCVCSHIRRKRRTFPAKKKSENYIYLSITKIIEFHYFHTPEINIIISIDYSIM